MALITADNFSYQGKKPLDARLVVQTLPDLLATPDYTIYDGILVYVISEDKYYTFNSNNTSDAILDKWRELTIDNSISPFDTIFYPKVFTVQVTQDETLSLSDFTGLNIKDINIGQYVSDKAGILSKVVSINESNNEFKVRILTKDTIIKTETVHYTKDLPNEIGKSTTINYSDLSTTESISNFSINSLIYDDNGTLVKVLSKDETNSTLTVTPISVDIALSTMDVYETSLKLDKEIGKQQTIDFASITTSKLIEDIEKNQLVYDENGTLAKIDLVTISTDPLIPHSITVTTITSSNSGTSIEAYRYLGTVKLDKVASNRTNIDFNDINTTKDIKELEINQLVYDQDGTLTKIVLIDIPNSKVLVQTLTTSGMTPAPILKELVIKEQGTNYQVGDIFQASNDTSVYGEVLAVGPNGEIEQVVLSSSSSINTKGTNAIVDYDIVIFGATGNNWSPLHNTSTQVAQIVSEPFEYEQGYVYTITNKGSNYMVDDVIYTGTHYVIVTQIGTNGEVEKVSYSRETVSSEHGTGLVITESPSNDIFIIPSHIWNNSKQNQFDLTNDDGASVVFNRLDNITLKGGSGQESLYMFTFDNVNGVITQEKTEVSGGNGLGKFEPLKNYKKNDVIINDNIIYICKDDHTSAESLGTDIEHWEEMRKQITSGMRRVKTELKQKTYSTASKFESTYAEGDASMFDEADNKFIAPVDGLYMLAVSEFYAPLSSVHRRDYYVTKNSINQVDGVQYNNLYSNLQSPAPLFIHLKKDDYLIPWYASYTSSTLNPTYLNPTSNIEFILLTDDKSDNLIAEADLVMPSSITKNTYTILTYENTSNLGVINTNGNIVLPEDGSYILSVDNLISSTGGAPASLETILTTKDGTAINALTTITHATCTKLQSAGFTHIITGSKGDTFTIKTYRTETQSNLTKSYDQKIRLFKIKSVDYHIDSHDLHKDSGSTLDYEDWVKSKLTNQQLTVKTTIDKSQTLNKSFMKYIYASGELSMFQDNKLIAPISGYYTFQLSPVVLNSSVSHSFALEKNPTASSWKKDALAWSPMVSANNANPGLNWFGWLDKDDYLMVDYYGSKDLTIDPQSETTATLTLVSTGLSSMSQYTADKPHLWPDNQEVDLGDGLYGLKLNVNGTTNTSITIDMTAYNISEIEKISGKGIVDGGGTQALIPCYYTNVAFIDCYYITNKILYLVRGKQYAQTSDRFTLYITYTKGGTN